MGISFDNLRVGHRYRIKNYGEETEFQLIEVLEDRDFLIKDLNSLELGNLTDLIRYGKGNDFEIREL